MKEARWCDIYVLIPEEHWDEFEKAVMEAARRLGTVRITGEGMTTGYGHTIGEPYLTRGGLTMHSSRTELVDKDEWQSS